MGTDRVMDEGVSERLHACSLGTGRPTERELRNATIHV